MLQDVPIVIVRQQREVARADTSIPVFRDYGVDALLPYWTSAFDPLLDVHRAVEADTAVAVALPRHFSGRVQASSHEPHRSTVTRQLSGLEQGAVQRKIANANGERTRTDIEHRHQKHVDRGPERGSDSLPAMTCTKLPSLLFPDLSADPERMDSGIRPTMKSDDPKMRGPAVGYQRATPSSARSSGNRNVWGGP